MAADSGIIRVLSVDDYTVLCDAIAVSGATA